MEAFFKLKEISKRYDETEVKSVKLDLERYNNSNITSNQIVEIRKHYEDQATLLNGIKDESKSWRQDLDDLIRD